ncbi:hypothetical protein J7643_08635 [bacterium]|nr:hypothetical protein [bacterium]
MKTAKAGLAIALLLSGCGRAVAPTVSTVQPRAAAPAQVAAKAPATSLVSAPLASAPKATAPQAPEAAPAPASFEALQWDHLRAIGQAGGLVTGLSSLTAEVPASYTTQIVPESTQALAQARAKAWAPDARQAYIGWGFWKVSLLSRVRHAYYSPSKKKVLKLEYSVSSVFLNQYEDDGDGYDLGFLVLRDAYDVHRYQVKEAHSKARSYGYRPGKNTTAALLNFVLLGPVWCFIDDRTWEPTVLIKADSGDVVTSGPLMWAASYLIGRAAAQ